MPQYTVNLQGAGQVVVNASDPNSALVNAGNPPGATVSSGSYTTGPGPSNGSSSSGGTPAGTPASAPGDPTGANVGAAQMLLNQAQQAAYQAYLNARLALDTDQEAYQKANAAAQQVLNQAQVTGTFNGQPTLAAQGQAQQNALSVASLTGVYTPPGAPTSAGPAGLQGYTTGQVVRSADGSQFGVVGPNGTIQTGQAAASAINAAAQRPGGILTISPADFNAGVQALSSAGTGSMSVSGTPTLAAQQQQAQLSGVYNGAPTEQAREANASTSLGYLNLLGSLRGPADYGNYLRVLGSTPGGINDLVSSASGNYVPASGATTGTTPTPQTLDSLANPGGDISYDQYLQAAKNLPAPNQISPDAWNAYTTSQKQMILGMYGQTGYDVNDVQDLYNQSLPKYASPSGAGTVKLS